MDAMYSKCGINCARCPSYKDNLLSDEDRRNCSQGWHTYHGFRLSPEKLIACDGCQPAKGNGNGTRYINCLIRRCALYNQIETCASCSAYPCEVLANRGLGNEWLANLVERVGKIPEVDFDVFVEPYLSLPHLEAIRSSLDTGTIVEIKTVSIKPLLASFPPELESTQGLKSVYQLLQDLNAPLTGLSYAQAETQKEKRTHLLKMLWSFALFGDFDEENNALLLDHKIYLGQKIHSSYDRVRNYFETLDDYGLHGEVIPLVKDRWLTPTRALRRQGIRESSPPWVMKMSADERIGGTKTLESLQACAAALADAFGKSAYRRFMRADLRVLCQ